MQYGAFPLDIKALLLQPLSVLSFVAACTQVVRLATVALVLPHRNAVPTAKTLTPLRGTTPRSLPLVLRRSTDDQYRCST